MEIRLMRMEIRNFKGIRTLDIDLNGMDAQILGANATGKTSVYDAFLWLLFDKDSSQSSKFSAKPVGPDGAEIHNLTTSVCTEMSIDGELHTLTRTMNENWVKQRGRAEAVFAGNVSGYEIDGVPKKASEFAEFRDRLADEPTFRLITNPAAFNALKWQDRRAHLLRLSGAPKELHNPKYAPVIDRIQTMGADDLKRSLQSQRRKLNSELDQIPARVDEVMALMPDVSDQQVRDAEFIVKDAEQDMERIRQMISDASREPDRVKSELSELMRVVQGVEERNRAACERARVERERQEANRARRIREIEKRMTEAGRKEEETRKRAEDAGRERDRLAAEWKRENAATYVADEIDHICPTCGQELPEEVVEKARLAAREAWQHSKQKKLDMIRESGKRAAGMRDELVVLAAEYAGQREFAAKELEALNESAFSVPDPIIEEVDSQTLNRINELKALAEMPESQNVAGLRRRMDELTALRDKHMAVLTQRDARILHEKRAEELSQRQQELGRLVAEADLNLMLVEEYVQEMCKRVEESVAARFPTVRWKLYERQINGGLADTCVCMVNGVPFADANNAARINAGLEIINVFSEHVGVRAPIFVDNAEAVNRVAATQGQQIQLIVTDDPELIVRKGA